jgi:lipopolysaccharide biosynthesis glycosyltransferase
VKGHLYFYQDEGIFWLSVKQEHTLRWLGSIRPEIPLDQHFINKSFLIPLTAAQASERLPLAAMVRLFLLWDLESQWILYMDGDLTVMHPFLSRLQSHINGYQTTPIWAVVDRSVPCSGPHRFPAVYYTRHKITIYNKNLYLYFNSGFLLFRNCQSAKEIIRHVITMAARLTRPFPTGDQDMLWAFSNSSLYGVLPTTFNCQPGYICKLECRPDIAIVHGRGILARIQAEHMFNRNLSKALSE